MVVWDDSAGGGKKKSWMELLTFWVLAEKVAASGGWR